MGWIWLFLSKDGSVGSRIDVDVPEFLGKFGIIEKLERPDTVRRKLVGLENTLHRSQADPRRLGLHLGRPLEVPLGGGPVTRSMTFPKRGGGTQRLFEPTRFVKEQSADALSHERRPVAPDYRLSLARPSLRPI